MSLQFSLLLQDFYHFLSVFFFFHVFKCIFKKDGFSFLDILGSGLDNTLNMSFFSAIIVYNIVYSYLLFLYDEESWWTISKVLSTWNVFKVSLSIIKNHHCGLWERSIMEEDTQIGFELVMVVFWVFFVIICEVVLKTFELSSANVKPGTWCF